MRRDTNYRPTRPSSIKNIFFVIFVLSLLLPLSPNSFGATPQEVQKQLHGLQQSIANLPKNEKDIANQLLQDWSEVGIETVRKVILTDSHYQIKGFLETLQAGATPQEIKESLMSMNLNEDSHSKVLAHIIRSLRENPQKLQRMKTSLESLRYYLDEQKVNYKIGLRGFNATLIFVDFLAIFYSLHNSFPQAAEQVAPFVSPLFIGFLGSAFLGEIANLRQSVPQIINNWRQKRKQKKFSENLVHFIDIINQQQGLDELSHKSTLFSSLDTEKLVFAAIPSLLNSFMKEISFLSTQSAIGQLEANRKFKIYNDFVNELNKNLTPVEKVHLLDLMKEKDVDPKILENISNKFEPAVKSFVHALHDSGFATDFLTSPTNAVQLLRLEEQKYSAIKAKSEKPLTYTLVGLTIATVIFSSQLAVGNTASPLDAHILFNLGPWLREHSAMMYSIAGISGIAPLIYNALSNAHIHASKGKIQTNIKRINSLTQILFSRKRGWLREAPSACQNLFKNLNL